MDQLLRFYLFTAFLIFPLVALPFSLSEVSEESESKIKNDHIQLKSDKLYGLSPFEKILSNRQSCKPTWYGQSDCVDIGTCAQDNIKYYKSKQSAGKCLQLNGRSGECCPIAASLKRSKRDKAVVDILEEIKEPANDLDLTKIGDSSECGYSRKSPKGAKEGKPEDAIFNDHPWIVALIIKKISLHYCGGALIDRRHILTAAHCVPEGVVPEGILVRLGEYDFNRGNDSNSVDAVVESIKYHEDYEPATYENDIALIKLKQDVEYNEFVRPVCLPAQNNHLYKENITVIAAGWGKTEYKGNMSDVLREVSIPLWDQNTCVYSFTQTIYETALCAAGYEGGLDSCQGDSGGPLVTQREDNRWVTVGVVSWGVKCGDKGKPGVYTRVNEYLEWIAKNL